MFEASLVNDAARTSRPYTVSVSALLQLGMAAVAVTYPLWHIEALPRVRLRAPSPFRNAIPLADPQPARPSAAPVLQRRPPLLVFQAPKLTLRNDAATATTQIDAPVLDGGPTGEPGPYIPGLPPGTGHGPIVASGPSQPPPVPVKKPDPVSAQQPVPVGGRVRQPLLLREVRPAYPPLAIAARIQGTVRIAAIISRDGMVRDARVVSGHPLLVAAALDAVRQWHYRPTILNDQPEEVSLALDVNFTLSR